MEHSNHNSPRPYVGPGGLRQSCTSPSGRRVTWRGAIWGRPSWLLGGLRTVFCGIRSDSGRLWASAGLLLRIRDCSGGFFLRGASAGLFLRICDCSGCFFLRICDCSGGFFLRGASAGLFLRICDCSRGFFLRVSRIDRARLRARFALCLRDSRIGCDSRGSLFLCIRDRGWIATLFLRCGIRGSINRGRFRALRLLRDSISVNVSTHQQVPEHERRNSQVYV